MKFVKTCLRNSRISERWVTLIYFPWNRTSSKNKIKMISLINLTVDMIIEGLSYIELMLIWKSNSDVDCAETCVRIILIIVYLIKHRLMLSIFRNKNVFIPQESLFVSCSYVWCGVTQSMHRTTLRFWQNIHLFSIFPCGISSTPLSSFPFHWQVVSHVCFCGCNIWLSANWDRATINVFCGSPTLLLHSAILKQLPDCRVVEMELWKQKFGIAPSYCILDGSTLFSQIILLLSFKDKAVLSFCVNLMFSRPHYVHFP